MKTKKLGILCATLLLSAIISTVFSQGLTGDSINGYSLNGNLKIKSAGTYMNFGVTEANVAAFATSASFYGFDKPIMLENGLIYTYNSNITFATTNFAHSIELMKILISNGNVGIGVPLPLTKLHINGSIRGNLIGGALKVETTSGYLELGPQDAYFSHFNTDRPYFKFNKTILLDAGAKIGSYNSSLSLGTDIAGERLVIDRASGKIGIGTAVPNQTLSVVGNMSISPLNTTLTTYGSSSLLITRPATDGSGQYISMPRVGTTPWSIGTVYNTSNFAIGTSRTNDVDFTNPSFVMTPDGKVGIGTVNPQYALDVKGTIRATEIKVVSIDSIPDYVFEPDYQLQTLSDVDTFIQSNKHLPNIPSAAEIKENGLSLVDMQVKLLKKVEELTLYAIDQQKRIEQLEKLLVKSNK